MAAPQRIRTRAPRIVSPESCIRNQEPWAPRPRMRAALDFAARRIREANEELDSSLLLGFHYSGSTIQDVVTMRNIRIYSYTPRV